MRSLSEQAQIGLKHFRLKPHLVENSPSWTSFVREVLEPRTEELIKQMPEDEAEIREYLKLVDGYLF